MKKDVPAAKKTALSRRLVFSSFWPLAGGGGGIILHPYLRINLSAALAIIGIYSLEIYTIHTTFVRDTVFMPDFIRRHTILLSYVYNFAYSLPVCAVICMVSKYVLGKLPLYKKLMLGIY
jgi:hypothetical protein